MKALLDTCVISELVAKQPNASVVAFVDNLAPEDIYLSVITIGEIIKGIEKLSNSRRKSEIRNWLQNDLMARFHGNILPVDVDVITEWGALIARLEISGKPLPAIDSLIAATILAHKMTLITRNVKGFETAGIDIVNPWIESDQ